MLLLGKTEDGHQLLLVEAKTNANNCWYAVVENLRQLALFTANKDARKIFNRRQAARSLPDELPVVGVVLAPESYYTARGQKKESVGPAKRLLAALGVDVRLAVWREAPTPAITIFDG